MQDEKGNDRAGDNSGQKTNQNRIKEESSPKTEHLIDAAEIVAGLVLGGIAIALSDAGFHILSLIFGFLAVICGLTIAAHLLQKFGLKYVKSGFVFTVILIAAVFCFLAIHKPPPELKPHFTLSLRIGDSPTSRLLLTNDFFFRAGMVNVIHSTNDFFLFNGIANGCVVIPTQTEESNKVFNFIAENDSPVKVTDLEVIVGFLKDWKVELDSAKWHSVGEHLMIPGWRLEMTNLQFWAAESPWPLFPGDSLTFPPITNLSIPKFNNPTNKIGLFELMVRSTDFENLISANVIFVRTSSSGFKPFVSGLKMETNGIWRPSISFKELEDLQK